MRRILFVWIWLAALVNPMLGQNETDALRHSQRTLTGSARAQGMGGAFSAVGADVTAGASNPAGFGLFRSSKFVISPAFRLDNTTADYLDLGGTGNRNHFTVSNWGYIVQKGMYYDNGQEYKEVERGLKSFTFAFGQHQLENYRRESNGAGFNPYSSIGQLFVQNANGINPSQLDQYSNERLAFDLLVIDTILNQDGRTYFSNPGNVDQTLQRREDGRRNEWFISLAGNFEDKLFLGATVGIQRLRYEQRFALNETDVQNLYQFYDPDPNNGFPLEIPTEQIRFTDWYGTYGTGINMRIGAIYRPADALRIGLSFQSPSYYSLTDTFNSQIVHVVNVQTGTEEYASPSLTPGRFVYNLSTPYRITGGLMYLFGKVGFAALDVEFVDYRSSNLSSQNPINTQGFYSFETENDNIQNLYSPTVNVRLGGEYRFDIFRFRAGYAYYGSPLSEDGATYQDFNNFETLRILDGSRKFLTLGLGIRQPNYFLDVALVNQQYKDKFSPYLIEDPAVFSPTFVNNSQKTSIILTVGTNF